MGKFILEKFWEFCGNSLGEVEKCGGFIAVGDVEKCGGFIAVGDVEDCWLWWR